MIYLDASALVTYVTERPYFPELHDFLIARSAFRGVTSTVGLIETVRNCDRIGNFPDLMTQLLREYAELHITSEIRDRAANVPGGLRALDAIHIASATDLSPLDGFLTYDERQAAAARLAGLRTLSPGS